MTVSSGISIPRETQIGAEIHIVHAGNINIHPSAVLGDRVTLMHDVTIGAGMTDEEGYPVIGDDVFIGAGAKILGGVTIGNGAMIAANYLVISDIPPGVTAIGVPARALPHSKGAPRRTTGDGAGKIPNR